MSPEEQERRRWAYAYTSRCASPPPAYGSPEWCALPDGPEKVAAVVIAAEALVVYDELRDMAMESYRLAGKRGEDQEFRQRKAEHRQEWGNKSYRPHPVNRRRRGDAA